MNDMITEDDLEEFQKEIIDDESEKVLLQKARQVGGTTAFILKMIDRIKEDECDIAVFTPSIAQASHLFNKVLERLEDRFPDMVTAKQGSKIRVGGSGYLRSFQKPSRFVDSYHDRSTDYDVVFVDNAGSDKMRDDVLESLINMCDSEDLDLWVCGTPHPISKDQGINEISKFQKLCTFLSRFSSYQVSARDVSHLDQEYIDHIEESVEDERAKNEIEGVITEIDEDGNAEYSVVNHPQDLPTYVTDVDDDRVEDEKYDCEELDLNVLDEIIVNQEKYTVSEMKAVGRKNLTIELVRGEDV